MTDQWRERFGRWELWRSDRMIAAVFVYDGEVRVTIDARKAWQVVHGRARSVGSAMRGVEKWLRHHAPER